MGNIKNKLSYILKNNDRLLAVFSKTTSFFLNLAGKFLKLNPNQLLITANSMGYNDSPRVIFEQMIKEPDLNHFEIVWALNDAEALPLKYRNRVKVVKPDTIAYFKTALKSKYWLTSVNIERGLHFKKPETKFLNTWHGIPIKTVGNAVKNRNDFNWTKTDFVCYSNEEEKKTFIRDFKAKTTSMIPCGLPRNDELYNVDENRVKQLKKSMNLPDDKKIILYAPTWRDSSDMGEKFTLDLPIDWSLWHKQLKDDYIILLRAHPYITEVKGFEFNDFVRNYSDYDNINDLLIVSDLLISDYSSVIYDYSILERPIICFAYDYEEYKQSRGLYFDLTKEMPNGIVEDENALIKTIKTLDWEKESKASKLLKEKRVVYGGQATKTCIDLLFRGEH